MPSRRNCRIRESRKEGGTPDVSFCDVGTSCREKHAESDTTPHGSLGVGPDDGGYRRRDGNVARKDSAHTRSTARWSISRGRLPTQARSSGLLAQLKGSRWSGRASSTRCQPVRISISGTARSGGHQAGADELTSNSARSSLLQLSLKDNLACGSAGVSNAL